MIDVDSVVSPIRQFIPPPAAAAAAAPAADVRIDQVAVVEYKEPVSIVEPLSTGDIPVPPPSDSQESTAVPKLDEQMSESTVTETVSASVTLDSDLPVSDDSSSAIENIDKNL